MAVEIKEIDGVKYVLESQYNATVKGMQSRISEYAEKVRGKETEISTLQTQVTDLSGKAGLTETLQQTLKERETQLSQANTRYERHSALSQHGITDSSVVSVFEHLYSSLDGEKPEFADWVKSNKEKPDEAPLAIRGFLSSQETPTPGAPPPRS